MCHGILWGRLISWHTIVWWMHVKHQGIPLAALPLWMWSDSEEITWISNSIISMHLHTVVKPIYLDNWTISPILTRIKFINRIPSNWVGWIWMHLSQSRTHGLVSFYSCLLEWVSVSRNPAPFSHLWDHMMKLTHGRGKLKRGKKMGQEKGEKPGLEVL